MQILWRRRNTYRKYIWEPIPRSMEKKRRYMGGKVNVILGNERERERERNDLSDIYTYINI